MCSLEAKGLLIDLMSLAHHGDPYGYVTNGGMPLTERELPQVLGVHPRTLRKCIELLSSHGRVVVESDGKLAIPRMIKDEEERAFFAEKGSIGGKKTWESLKGGLEPPLEPSLEVEQSKSKIESKSKSSPPTPHGGNGREAASLAGFPLDQGTYDKHPALKVLHGEPNLRGITLEVYLTIIRRRSEFMNPIEAAKEAASAAALQSGIRSQGPFVDRCFSRYETEHIAQIKQAQDRFQKRERIRREIITFVCENWRANPAMIDRARSDFSREYGEGFIDRCQKDAEKIVAGLIDPPAWLDRKVVDFADHGEPAAVS